MSTAQIVFLSILIGVVLVTKLVIDILIISNLTAIKRNTKFTANKLKQLCKLTSDNQIYVRGVYNAISGDNEVLAKIAEEQEKEKKKKKTTRKTAAKPKAEPVTAATEN
ncbi:MAG: hypothetical protein IJ470_02825 [Clostridia bacterium]|nr:hypothetical protein [Clostridia bacterium]